MEKDQGQFNHTGGFCRLKHKYVRPTGKDKINICTVTQTRIALDSNCTQAWCSSHAADSTALSPDLISLMETQA
jgi:hypothetical protein